HHALPYHTLPPFSNGLSGINNAVSRIAAALAIAVLGLIVAARFGAALEQRLAPLPLSTQARAQLVAERARLGDARVPTSVDARSAPAVRQAIDEAFTSAYQLVMLIGAALALAGGAISFMTIPGRLSPFSARAAPPRQREATHPVTERG
ncbi:MAG: hypothetical protein IVW57_15145, partial [Ktedonobacterales bacterium]|nr:hypothetical protein [Ktedonobacterales bacterium]